VSHVYCSECGFQSPAAATYCARCGALLAYEEGGETTMSLPPDEVTDEENGALDVVIEGTALVVRAGGGIAGETFTPTGPRTLIGRSPDCEIFLDDVTVSRRHATFTREGTTFSVADAGSLNGTYVNRDRIDTVVLKDTDEVQIGKYRLVFFQGHETP